MARVGLIGIGDMGSGMAANILKNGHELVVYDLRPEQLEPFVEQGAYAAKNLGEVGERSDFVFVMVMNGDQIKAILNNGLNMKPGSTFICTATILRSELIEVAQSLEERGYPRHRRPGKRWRTRRSGWHTDNDGSGTAGCF